MDSDYMIFLDDEFYAQVSDASEVPVYIGQAICEGCSIDVYKCTYEHVPLHTFLLEE